MASDDFQFTPEVVKKADEIPESAKMEASVPDLPRTMMKVVFASKGMELLMGFRNLGAKMKEFDHDVVYSIWQPDYFGLFIMGADHISALLLYADRSKLAYYTNNKLELGNSNMLGIDGKTFTKVFGHMLGGLGDRLEVEVETTTSKLILKKGRRRAELSFRNAPNENDGIFKTFKKFSGYFESKLPHTTNIRLSKVQLEEALSGSKTIQDDSSESHTKLSYKDGKFTVTGVGTWGTLSSDMDLTSIGETSSIEISVHHERVNEHIEKLPMENVDLHLGQQQGQNMPILIDNAIDGLLLRYVVAPRKTDEELAKEAEIAKEKEEYERLKKQAEGGSK